MLFQINDEGKQMGLLQVVKNHNEERVKPVMYDDIITQSLEKFKDNGEENGYDIYDLDDFVIYHNLRNVLILERVFVEEIEY